MGARTAFDGIPNGVVFLCGKDVLQGVLDLALPQGGAGRFFRLVLLVQTSRVLVVLISRSLICVDLFLYIRPNIADPDSAQKKYSNFSRL